jgi:hypothetical protein
VINCTESAANCAAVALQFIVLLFMLWCWELWCGDVWCNYWLGEMKGNGKGYRKVLTVVMWWCVLHLLVGGDEGKWKGLQKDTDSCDVVMCAAVTGWRRRREMERITGTSWMLWVEEYLLVRGDEGKWEGLQKGTDSCDVVMCGVVTGWRRRREMERVTERYWQL